MWKAALVLASAAVAPAAGAAQETSVNPARGGRRAPLERAREISLARSAAPAAVSARATVLVLGDTGFVVAAPGDNGVTCLVDRSWPGSLEPHCYDPEGSATILPLRLREAALRQQGKDEETIARDLADGLRDGRYRLPRRPALTWMLSRGQQLLDDDGRPAGNWRPHLMIYYPFLTAAELGLGGEPALAAGILVDAGRPTSNLMVVVPEFVDPVPASSP